MRVNKLSPAQIGAVKDLDLCNAYDSSGHSTTVAAEVARRRLNCASVLTHAGISLNRLSAADIQPQGNCVNIELMGIYATGSIGALVCAATKRR